MPNLFPDSDYDNNNTDTNVQEPLVLKGSYLFDFDKGEFVKNPDGTVKKCDKLIAYKQWCQMATLTDRGKFLYSDSFGEEFYQLTGTGYSQEAIELEVKRMTAEALMVHPFTKDVTNFSFTWQNNGELYYTYTVITADESSFSLNNSVNVVNVG
ncbi:DUF2634 domain-containing protein [Clostridium autoethanogenum]|uniref:DUF2634 domain-containing protein n=1 Tax=Clostridium autoethanogenum TaxID=84023 RepID=A0A3M0T2P9_9CLOT|nr:DUF2634 domain-containing protein [Clostridium autoethanogenum]RMD04900.1 DUF2634 domain-containing protein [Clostridium autoethanogenum]